MADTNWMNMCFKFKKLTIVKGTQCFSYQGFLVPCFEQTETTATFSSERFHFFTTEGTILTINQQWEEAKLENTRLMDERLKQGMLRSLKQAKTTYKKQLQLQKFLLDVQEKHMLLQNELIQEENHRNQLHLESNQAYLEELYQSTNQISA